MAGQIPGFDPDAFRDGIRFAMDLGAPPDASLQATFVFPKVKTTTGPVNAQGVPLDPSARATFAPSKPPVKVACGIEYGDGTTTDTSIGRFSTDKIVVTVLDSEYEQIQGFELVLFNTVPYYYKKELRVAGLGPVGVYQFLCVAEGAT